MKKLKLFFVAMLLSAVAINSYAQSVNSTIKRDGITYTYTSVTASKRTVSVTGVDATIAGDKVVIPGTIKDAEDNFVYKVTKIECSFGSNVIGTLELSENMEHIYKLRGTAIDNIILPSTVNQISYATKDYGMHPCTGLKNIYVSADNENYCDIDGVLFSKDGTSLIQYPEGRTDPSYTVPDGVTTITTPNAIYNSYLTSLDFGSTVNKVDASALVCANVTDVTIPASLTSVASLTGLKKLLNYHVVEGHTVYSDIDGVLCNSDKTSLIGYPIGRNDEEYYIPSSIVTVKKNAFDNCTFKSLSFEKAVNLKRIESLAFRKCKGIVKPLDLSKTQLERIDSLQAFSNCGITKVIFPETIKYIGAKAFESDQITEVNFPEGLEYIGSEALSASQMTTIHLPSTLTTFGAAVFSANTNLTAITVAEGNPVFAADNGVLYTKDFKELVFYPRGKTDESYTINEATEVLRSSCMTSCKLKTVVIPESLKTVGSHAFDQCPNLETIVWPENCNLETIKDYGFARCYKIGTFDIPASVKTIESYAFRQDKMEEVRIPDNSKLDILNLLAWWNCPNLTKITIGKNTSVRRVQGFVNNYKLPESLKEIIVEEGNTKLKYLSNDTFKSSNIESVIIAEDCGLESIGSNCFNNCQNLTTLVLPGAVKTLGNSCFYKTPNLKSIVFTDTDEYPAQLSSIGDNTFWECGIESFVVPRSVTTISRQAFHSCEALESVSIPAGTNSVDKQAFYLCSKLEEINVDKANTTYASSDGIFCNKMKTSLIIYPAGKETNSFQLLPPSLKTIGSMSFFYSTNLEKVMIPKHVEKIGISAFWGCDNLTDIVLLGDAPIEGVADVENAFPADIATKAKLWVRYGTKAAYQADPFWGKFSNIEETKMGEAADGDENHNYEFFVMAERSANVLSVKNNALDYTIVMPETVTDGTNEYNVDYLGDFMLEDAQENVKEVVVKHTPKYIGANAFANADAFLCDDVDDMSTIRFEYDKATFKGKYNEGTNLYMKKSVAEACLEDDKWADLTDVIQWQVPLPAIKTDYGTFSREFAIDLDAINPDKAKPNVIAFTAGEPQYDAKKNLTTVRMISINHTGDNPEGSSGDGDGTFIPANTGVLLKAYNGSSTDFTKATTDETGATTEASGDYYQIAETQTESYGGANLMASVTEHSRTIQPTENGYTNFYVAQGKFWSFTAARTSTVHKSYLQLSNDVYPAGAKLAIVFVEPDSSESTTGIESINANVDDNDNLYNLQGQRVSKSAKGFYIKNGKKYIKN